MHDLPASDLASIDPALPALTLDVTTRAAARIFLQRLDGVLPVSRALVFGSRARGDHVTESDADLAVIMDGPPGDRWSITREMARLAFDVLIATDVLIDPLALWEIELAQPDHSSNPALVRAVLRDGLQV